MEYEDLTLDVLEKRQEELLEELREVEQELENYEEDYMPHLEVNRSSLKAQLRKDEKEINKRNGV